MCRSCQVKLLLLSLLFLSLVSPVSAIDYTTTTNVSSASCSLLAVDDQRSFSYQTGPVLFSLVFSASCCVCFLPSFFVSDSSKTENNFISTTATKTVTMTSVKLPIYNSAFISFLLRFYLFLFESTGDAWILMTFENGMGDGRKRDRHRHTLVLLSG